MHLLCACGMVLNLKACFCTCPEGNSSPVLELGLQG